MRLDSATQQLINEWLYTTQRAAQNGSIERVLLVHEQADSLTGYTSCLFINSFGTLRLSRACLACRKIYDIEAFAERVKLLAQIDTRLTVKTLSASHLLVANKRFVRVFTMDKETQNGQ